MAEKDSFFDKVYGASQEVKDALKKPFVEKKLKRTFESYIDAVEQKLLDAEGKLDKYRQNFENLDLNGLVNLLNEQKQYRVALEIVKEEYKVMFGEAYKG